MRLAMPPNCVAFWTIGDGLSGIRLIEKSMRTVSSNTAKSSGICEQNVRKFRAEQKSLFLLID